MSNLLDITWYKECEKEFVISTVEELYEFARLSDFYNFEGQTIKLGNNIVINNGNARDWKESPPEKRWIPISNFAGCFDGQGYYISGMYGKAAFSKLAMFIDTKSSCRIRNLRLVNSAFENHGGNGTASFVAHGSGALEHLYSDAFICCNGELCGGIVSNVKENIQITHCWFDGVVQQTGRRMGGIIAEISEGEVDINGCLFTGTIITTDSISSQNDGVYAGGMIGRIEGDSQIRISDTYVCGQVSAPNNAKYLAASIGRVFDGAKVWAHRVFERNADRKLGTLGRGTIQGTITKM